MRTNVKSMDFPLFLKNVEDIPLFDYHGLFFSPFLGSAEV